jgi:hypothetical protein
LHVEITKQEIGEKKKGQSLITVEWIVIGQTNFEFIEINVTSFPIVLSF